MQHPESFYRWFGKSKVVDKKGYPLRVYHGTGNVFSEFNFSAGINAPVPQAVYFSNSPVLASYVADISFKDANVKPVYLKIEYPLVIDAKGEHAIRLTNLVIDKLRNGYYDGVIIKNVREFQQDYLTTTYAVFRNSQIRSALQRNPRKP